MNPTFHNITESTSRNKEITNTPLERKEDITSQ